MLKYILNNVGIKSYFLYSIILGIFYLKLERFQIKII